MFEPICETCEQPVSVCKCPTQRDILREVLKSGNAGIVIIEKEQPKPKIFY